MDTSELATLPPWLNRVNSASVPNDYSVGLSEASAALHFACLSTGTGYSKTYVTNYCASLRRRFSGKNCEYIVRPWMEMYLDRKPCGVNEQLWLYTHALSELGADACLFIAAEDGGMVSEEDSLTWFSLTESDGGVFLMFVYDMINEGHFFEEHPTFVLSMLKLVQAMLDQYLGEVRMGYRKSHHTQCSEGTHGEKADSPDSKHSRLVDIVTALSNNAWRWKHVFVDGAFPDSGIPRAAQLFRKALCKILVRFHHVLPCTHNFVSEGREDLCRLAIHLWTLGPQDDPEAAVPLLILVFGHVMGHSPQPDALAFTSADIISTYGAKNFIARIPGVLQKHPPAQVAVAFGYTFNSALKHPDFLPYFASSGTLNALRGMLDAQGRKADQTHQQHWDVYANSLLLFTHCLQEASLEDGAQPLIRDIDFLSVLSRSLILSAQLRNSNYSYCLGLVKACLMVFPAIYSRVPKNKLRKALKQSLTRCWYRTMVALYDLRPEPHAEKKLHGKHSDMVAGWQAIGKQAELQPEQDKAEMQQWGKKLCSWRDCLYFTTVSEEPPRACKGCGEVNYCSAHCQLEDWRKGGHKKACGKRLK